MAEAGKETSEYKALKAWAIATPILTSLAVALDKMLEAKLFEQWPVVALVATLIAASAGAIAKFGTNRTIRKNQSDAVEAAKAQAAASPEK